MKNYLLVGVLSLLSAVSWAQCSAGGSGTTCTGPLSVQPQSGNKSQSAITLVDLGLPGVAPAAGQYTLSISGGMLVESDNGNNYHPLMGAQGPQGAQGPAGSQGAVGAAGSTGPQGIQGSLGLPGAVGPAGPVGGQGLAGAPGPPGAVGAAGPIGLPGTQGVPGPAGAVGSAGPVGGMGPAGPSGPPGAVGAIGPIGLPGAIGPAGVTGLQGAAGATGSQGSQGPQGPSGTTAAPSDYSFYYGTGFKAGVGTIEVGGSLDRDQIDMSNATSVRFVITLGAAALPSGSYSRAEYTADGTNWYALSENVPVTTPNGIYPSGWQGLPNGANGDYVVRIVVFNAGTGAAYIGLHQLHVQFK
jgi:hypothetical protein